MQITGRVDSIDIVHIYHTCAITVTSELFYIAQTVTNQHLISLPTQK